MRILILNWRCPRNPRAGGAEFLTHQIARRLVAGGDEVEWFAASFVGAPAHEELDGIRIVRSGRQWTVHWHAILRYRGKLRGRFDAVIDEVNTIPFFSPLWVDIPFFMFIHQLAREVWWYESPFPINVLGYLTEPLYLRLYRRTPVLTVSASTEMDLRDLGFSGPVTMVPEGIEPITHVAMPKAPSPTFIYVGRMTPSKRVADLVRALDHFRRQAGVGDLWLVGGGPEGYQRSLRGLIDRLGLGHAVRFWGRVTTSEKHRLMAEAHVLLMASVREGWGLVVTEANACGTPAVVYDVAGLRDAVRNEETGLVVNSSPEALAAGMLRLWMDHSLYLRLAGESQRWSRTFSFDDATEGIRERIARAVA